SLSRVPRAQLSLPTTTLFRSCTSVHKSQGSEYPAVVMPVVWVMPSLMNRNLLYTAVTRAKRLVVLVGREDALWAYVRNAWAEVRYTRLAQRLEELLQGGAAGGSEATKQGKENGR